MMLLEFYKENRKGSYGHILHDINSALEKLENMKKPPESDLVVGGTGSVTQIPSFLSKE